MTPADAPRRRCRDLGIIIGTLPPGPTNSLTDVRPVIVGHHTLCAPPRFHSGITAILPHRGPGPLAPLSAGVAVGNGFGKLIGSTQIEETGRIESPILLTSTLSAFAVADALVRHVLALPGCETIRSFNPVVGETNDGVLNDIRNVRLGDIEVAAAIAAARDGMVAEGNVGAGTGTMAFGWKGGIGSASRVVRRARRRATLGVLVQANFGGDLMVAGVPIGRLVPPPAAAARQPAPADGSIMIVVATDAPVDPDGLRRLARRALLGIARTGGWMAHGSGDYALAVSTAEAQRAIPLALLDGLFQAAAEATEEAILNALFMADPVVGHRGSAAALPAETVAALVRASRAATAKTHV